MKPMGKAVAVALIHVLLVCSLGAKLLYDRRSRPRAWFRAELYDPNLPIRGRYISLQIDVPDSRSPEEINKKFDSEIKTNEKQRALYEKQPTATSAPWTYNFGNECGSIVMRNGAPVAVFDRSAAWNCDDLSFIRRRSGDTSTLHLNEPVLFFISDTAQAPSRLAAGEELWVMATVPRKGPPRPLELGIKKTGESAITPLNLH